jgi:hypothetical protein
MESPECQEKVLIILITIEDCNKLTVGYELDDWGSRVRFPAGAGIFVFTTASRMAPGPTQPPIQ